MAKKVTKKRYAPKLHLKKGDRVVVVAGVHKGSSGEVLEVLPLKNKAIVDGLNLKKKHMRPTNESQGGIVEIAAPIHASNLMLADPKTGEPTRIGRKIMDGRLVRYSKKSGEII